MPITLADGHLIIKPEFRWDTGVLGYAAANANSIDNGGGVVVDPNSGSKYTTGGGLYETITVDDNGKVIPKVVAQTSGQSTIGLAFIYKY
jgi:hypothetical protein